MKVLLTIEEYKERIINLVCDVAEKTINPSGDDWFKFEYIRLMVSKCLTDNFVLVDVCNQMFINVFGRDRNGKIWCDENINQIDEKEAEEFDSQEWYRNFNEKAKQNYEPTYLMKQSKEYGRDLWDRIWYVRKIAQDFFINDSNIEYELVKEIFKRLYGHEYEVDRDFKCK